MRLLFFVVLIPALYPATAFDAQPAGFTLRAGELIIPYRIFALFVEPGEMVRLEPQGGGDFVFKLAGREQTVQNRWRWRAPLSPGMRVLEIVRRHDGTTMQIHLFVRVPATRVQKQFLNGYRIGRYPPALPLTVKNRAKQSVYHPPRGFVEVSRNNSHIQLSPHFKLGDFVAKQKSDYPKYLVLREELLLKLEFLLQKLNQAGVHAPGFVVMSGYRTPFYNRAIGNVARSRHVYGGAADIYVDAAPRDGIMDDLNKDGKFDKADADWLYDFVNRLSKKPAYRNYIGGLGSYGPNRYHGAFLHVDVRGRKARWGR